VAQIPLLTTFFDPVKEAKASTYRWVRAPQSRTLRITAYSISF